MQVTRLRTWHWGLLGVAVVSVALLAGCPLDWLNPLPPCEDTGEDGGGDGGGDTGGDTECPPASTLIDVHLFKYDPDTGEYVLGESRVSQAEVERDLTGALCGQCHQPVVDELKDTVHYRWASRNDNVLFPGGGAHGMIDRACGLPASSALVNYTNDIELDECGKCHIGRFPPMMEGAFAAMFAEMGLPDAEEQAGRLIDAGLDCLICHAREYRSVPLKENLQVSVRADEEGSSPTATGDARLARDDTDFDGDGQPDPLIDTDGDGEADTPLMMDTDGDGTPDTPWPTVAQDRSFAAVASIGHTTDESCLRCHEHARTGYKRGTLFREGHDVHAVSDAVAVLGGGEGRHCVACHTAEHHKFVRGDLVGGDLMASDYAVGSEANQLTCTTCHAVSQLEGVWHMSRHTDVIACETCHIPYASGTTYSLYGHGGQLNFGRNEDGQDTKLITADHFIDDRNDEDVNTDWEAYRVRPVLMWFDGRVSFLAQSLSVRGTPGAKITPFKPMANGMVFDRRFFEGEMATNAALDGTYQYNAYSMYRFMAGGSNADVFAALDFLDLTPDEARAVTLDDFFSEDPDRQAMALMQIFPNMLLFEKTAFGYVRYVVGSNQPWETDVLGMIAPGQAFVFDMVTAVNAGLQKLMGFNGPMGLPADYAWYPPVEDTDDLLTMKVPDGTLIKMFLGMQGAMLPPEEQADFFAAIAEYPAYSNGITLGGHGVRPKEEALGADWRCTDCHASGGVMDHPVPVTNTEEREIPGLGPVNFPLYRWHYYQLHRLTDLGVTTENAEVVAGAADVDIAGDPDYVRISDATILVNYMNPAGEGSFRAPDHPDALAGTGLSAADLITNGGSWMPVLEPDVHYVPNYEVLGYTAEELFFLDQ